LFSKAKEEEIELVSFLKDCAAIGYPVTPKHLMQKAHEISNTHSDDARRFGEKGLNFFIFSSLKHFI
jgi:hypothetical protein